MEDETQQNINYQSTNSILYDSNTDSNTSLHTASSYLIVSVIGGIRPQLFPLFMLSFFFYARVAANFSSFHDRQSFSS